MQVLEENMSKRRVGGRESQEDAEGTNFKETSHEMIPHIEVEEEEVVCCKTSGVSSKTKYAAASFLPHSPTAKGGPTLHGGWAYLHGGQSPISPQLKTNVLPPPAVFSCGNRNDLNRTLL